jgi:hypothetical protein
MIDEPIPADGILAREDPGVCQQCTLAVVVKRQRYLAVISASRIGKPDVEQCCGDLDYIVRNTNAGWLRPGLILLRGLWQDSLSIGNCEQQANCESR